MSHTRVWDHSAPLVSEVVKYGPEAIRKFKEDFSERFGVDHIIGESTADGAGQDGVHSQVTLSNADADLLSSHGGAEGSPSDCMTVYSTDNVNGVNVGNIELCVLSPEGSEIQITKRGSLINAYKNTLSNINNDNATELVTAKNTNATWNLAGVSSSRQISLTEVYSSNDDVSVGSTITGLNGRYYIEFTINPFDALLSGYGGLPGSFPDVFGAVNTAEYNWCLHYPFGQYVWEYYYWGIYYSFSSNADRGYYDPHFSIRIEIRKNGSAIKTVYLVKENILFCNNEDQPSINLNPGGSYSRSNPFIYESEHKGNHPAIGVINDMVPSDVISFHVIVDTDTGVGYTWNYSAHKYHVYMQIVGL